MELCDKFNHKMNDQNGRSYTALAHSAVVNLG